MPRADAGRGADAPKRAAARAAARAAPDAAAATASPRELVLAADQFIITPAGRAEDAARARAAGDEVAHRHRRLPLVHRLGPRHDDQPRGADARDRPARRGRLHPAHVRPLRPRRPDPEPVSRRASARASITPPTRRSGSSTPSTATCEATGDRATLARAAARRCSTSSTHHLRGHALRHRRRSGATACCAGRARATSSPGWTRRWTTGS